MLKFIALALILVPLSLFAQNNKTIDISGHGDCSSALSINPIDEFGPTTAPNGYGKLLEFQNNPQNSLYYFEEEHNSVWYKFMIPYTGYLVFDIKPLKLADDYDFLLYKYSGKGFCSKVFKKEVLPVRSNISRNDVKQQSKTGLNLESEIKFKDDGPGKSYSKAVKVRKGEIYYLVLDNVYDNGEGHTIKFNYKKEDGSSAIIHEISGKVLGEDNIVPGEIEVILEDIETGKVIAKVKADEKSGEFTFEMPETFDKTKTYNISIFANNHFFKDIEFIPSEEEGKINKLSDVKVQKLKKGQSYRINNINFYSNSPQYIPEAEMVLKRLLRLMKENPNISIEIEGHINGCTGSPEGRQLLSESRAKTVFDYLERNGIDPKRISTIGYGCKKMIYPDPKDEKEQKCNRRVEIKITKT